MNILHVSANFQNNILNSKKPMNNGHVIQPKFAQTLNKDTVTFTGGVNKISDFVTKGVEDNMSRLERIATTYLDVLESVAYKLKEHGVSFDRAYCEQSPVKSPEAYTSKIMRSGKFKVPDSIRATLYVKNPYDLSTLNDLILPEMKKRGYILADTEMTIEDLIKRGYVPTEAELKKTQLEKLVPDLDIRLEDANSSVTQLAPELRYSIGKPQKSGYEDIQMRFVRDFDTKKAPIQHELLILFGPNYSKAKHLESEKVYAHLRQFDELRCPLDDLEENTDAVKANRYIDLLKQMFRGKVSEKLFLNAKNKDLYDLEEEIPIRFSKTDMQMFDSYFTGLKERLSSCYKAARSSAQSSETATKQINTDARFDRTLIKKIRDNLQETIDYFNYQHDLQKQPS